MFDFDSCVGRNNFKFASAGVPAITATDTREQIRSVRTENSQI